MKKKKVVITAVAVLAAAGGLFAWTSANAQSVPAVEADTSTLERGTISEKVSASGTIESASSVNVYAKSNQSSPVMEVNVKVGDVVQAGDVLCTLDPQAVQESIRRAQANLSAAESSGSQAVKSAQQSYQNAREALEQGLNSQLNAASDAVQQAQESKDAALRALEKAQKSYNDEKAKLETNLNAEILAAESTLQNAKTAMDRAQKAYRERRDEQTTAYKDTQKEYRDQKKVVDEARDFLEAAQDETPPDAAKIARARTNLEDAEAQLAELKKELDDYEANDEGYDEDDPTRQSLRQLREAAEDAEAAYSAAYKNLEALRAGTSQQLSSLEDEVNEAQIQCDQADAALANAQRDQQAAQLAVEQGLEDAQQAVATSQAGADQRVQETELEILREQLESCTVYAPVSGTVTAVYAEVGAPASGVMFVIEDTDALQVRVEINEYDINNVTEGMKTMVRADAIDGQEFEGVLSSIAPAAIKNDPETESGRQDVQFEAIVTVTQADTPLRIGMSAKADVITEEKTDVFAVPFEAVTTDAQGQEIIYTVTPGENGLYIPEEIPVETGLEGDYDVEISGDGLTDGMTIIADGKSVIPGVPVSVPELAAAQGAESSGEAGGAQ